jgi:hypothetical protein
MGPMAYNFPGRCPEDGWPAAFARIARQAGEDVSLPPTDVQTGCSNPDHKGLFVDPDRDPRVAQLYRRARRLPPLRSPGPHR